MRRQFLPRVAAGAGDRVKDVHQRRQGHVTQLTQYQNGRTLKAPRISDTVNGLFRVDYNRIGRTYFWESDLVPTGTPTMRRAGLSSLKSM